MKLEKAIEITTIIVKDTSSPYLHDEQTALKLLIEAGKAILAFRPYDDTFSFYSLPGETEE